MQLDQNGLYDIYSISYVPFWQQKWFLNSVYYGTIALLIGIVIIALYVLVRWYKSRQVPVIIQVITEITVLLDTTQKAAEIEHTRIYTQSLKALKKYYAYAHGKEWVSATETELIEYLAHYEVDAPWHYSLLKDFLHRSSNAKYAQSFPSRDVVIADLQAILAYLQTHLTQISNKQ